MSLSRESSEEVHIALGKQGGIFDGLIDLIGERSPGFYEQTPLATYAPHPGLSPSRSRLLPDLRAWLRSVYGG